MRVLLVSGTLPPVVCGVGEYTNTLADALARFPGTQVAVLTSAEVGRQARDYETFPVMRDWKAREFPAVMDVLRRWRPDVVHIQLPTLSYRGRLPYRLPAFLWPGGFPIVQTWHEYLDRGGRRRDVPSALFGSDVIVVRPGYRESMSSLFRFLSARKRFHLIPNGPTVPRVELDDLGRASVRERYGARGRALLAFFGLCHEHKGIDDLLAAMDPARHHLVIVGGMFEADPYQAALIGRVRDGPLGGHVTLAGFLPPEEAARVLAAADAVVLPFRRGGGDWNTSIKAAALQGTLVITTSKDTHGFDPDANVYRARPSDPRDLAEALRAHLGKRLPSSSPIAGPGWPEIAARHLAVYREALGAGSG